MRNFCSVESNVDGVNYLHQARINAFYDDDDQPIDGPVRPNHEMAYVIDFKAEMRARAYHSAGAAYYEGDATKDINVHQDAHLPPLDRGKSWGDYMDDEFEMLDGDGNEAGKIPFKKFRHRPSYTNQSSLSSKSTVEAKAPVTQILKADKPEVAAKPTAKTEVTAAKILKASKPEVVAKSAVKVTFSGAPAKPAETNASKIARLQAQLDDLNKEIEALKEEPSASEGMTRSAKRREKDKAKAAKKAAQPVEEEAAPEASPSLPKPKPDISDETSLARDEESAKEADFDSGHVRRGVPQEPSYSPTQKPDSATRKKSRLSSPKSEPSQASASSTSGEPNPPAGRELKTPWSRNEFLKYEKSHCRLQVLALEEAFDRLTRQLDKQTFKAVTGPGAAAHQAFIRARISDIAYQLQRRLDPYVIGEGWNQHTAAANGRYQQYRRMIRTRQPSWLLV
jgi:hypothetical protein